MDFTTQRLDFDGSHGAKLAARLDMPVTPVRAYAIFAHCFTCSKDLHASRAISSCLARAGIAVLRFDFTGLGSSGGDFASTNFSSNIEDLVIAADHLRKNFAAPSILIGHSLGGAAVIAAASQIDEVRAVATIGAPADAEHVAHNFAADIDEIETKGEAQVELAGRTFSIRKQFLDDLKKTSVTERAATLGKALLVLHSPVDATVDIDNAAQIYTAARHPKSFISLDKADHLLARAKDADFAANMIAAWSARYLDPVDASVQEAGEGVVVSETGLGKFHNTVQAGRHRLIADEPESVGGLDAGPTPYGYLATALGACTNMTIRMYADFKKLDVGAISVRVRHDKIHAADCEECTHEEREAGGKIDRFEREITVEGLNDPDLADKLLSIADKCPVHRTLEAGAKVATKIGG